MSSLGVFEVSCVLEFFDVFDVFEAYEVYEVFEIFRSEVFEVFLSEHAQTLIVRFQWCIYEYFAKWQNNIGFCIYTAVIQTLFLISGNINLFMKTNLN